ncbi:hypothetical protein lerEdw1_008687 [Lerista edwardsae]|nr:hypothetical protein lerEdw1_008687 [Lerista edwardsae]
MLSAAHPGSSLLLTLSFTVLFRSQGVTPKPNPCLERNDLPSFQVIPNTAYNCMELNLPEIPAALPDTTVSLDLSFNPLERLASNYFSSLFALKFLDLTRCLIQRIEDDAFLGLCNLSVLILTANPLQFLGPRAFHGLTSLQKLVAVEVGLSLLTSLPIGPLTSLQELNLSNNHIESLKLPEFFSRFTFLCTLSLQSNKISAISGGDLAALPRQNLTLVLSRNDLKHIQPNSFAGVHLQELALRGCFENSTLMQAGLRNLSGLRVHRLVLGDYRNIERVESFPRPLLDGLCHMHLQEISLISLEVDDTSDLSDCLSNISIVRLANTHIKRVYFPANTSIQRFEVKNSWLKEVPALELSRLKELRVLRLTDNRKLAKFEYFKNLRGLRFLEVLDLSNNKLTTSICWACLREEIPNLKLLNLSFNLEVGVPAEVSGPSKLECLELQHTRLEGPGQIPAFLSLKNLLYLDISYTQTEVITGCSFCGLDNLQVLKMAGNAFENHQLANSFHNLTKLRILDISSCRIQRISPGSFSHLLQLRELNISRNKLLSLRPVTDAFLPLLTSLDLSCNQLAALSEKDLEKLPPSLGLLDLSANLFDCSCDHLSFLRWAQEHRGLLQRVEQMVCHTPGDFKGLPLVAFETSSCRVSAKTVAIIVSVSLVVILLLGLVYKYYFHLYYMAVLLRGERLSREQDSTYDAFVIYSSEDQDWVKRELEDPLEGGVPRFRLCLYYRDFVPGVSIITNIIKEGFQSSRKVIAVVSSHFLESRWCNFELEVAQSWQLLDSKASLVLIVLEGVDKAAVQRKLGLFRYLRRNTYLVWKDWELSKHIFLRQLRAALLDGKTWNEEELRRMLTG